MSHVVSAALIAISTSWVIAMLVMGTDGGADIIDLLLKVYGGGAIALGWVLWLVIVRVRKRRWPRGVAAWLVPALLVVGVFADRPLLAHLRFRLSESALTSFADQMRADPDAAPALPVWIGLYRVREVDVQQGAVRIITAPCHLADDCGFVHSPAGEPPRIGEDMYAQLRGSWWTWWRSW